ncbi:hypothetical protein ACH41E_33985 [Streptomyces sp. NPDC020412]|uniref:hypothetical protein n=1 Tax=Streptomyces sp. NPDC020412 TaxID=3365073 RepID=UPI0037A8E3A5
MSLQQLRLDLRNLPLVPLFAQRVLQRLDPRRSLDLRRPRVRGVPDMSTPVSGVSMPGIISPPLNARAFRTLTGTFSQPSGAPPPPLRARGGQ